MCIHNRILVLPKRRIVEVERKKEWQTSEERMVGSIQSDEVFRYRMNE